MAIVKKYPAIIQSIHNNIQGVYTLELKSLDKPFKYEPGQFLHFALDDYDPAGQWPDSRCFSMQSSPSEELLRLTYAVKGKFTRRMQNELKPGKQVTLKLPYGNLFIQPHNKMNTVFIAGGTGVTPFLSLFMNDSFKGYTYPRIYLGFRSISYNIYEKELPSTKLCNLKIFYEDIQGLLNIHEIFSENSTSSDYFISGPPMMIKIFKLELMAFGVPANQILTDDWE